MQSDPKPVPCKESESLPDSPRSDSGLAVALIPLSKPQFPHLAELCAQVSFGFLMGEAEARPPSPRSGIIHSYFS